MFVLPMERYQEACAALNTFTKDMNQLTQRAWEEVGSQQFEFLRLCQDYSERQMRVLENGYGWNEHLVEQASITTDFWRQLLSKWGDLVDSFTETSVELRASVNRMGPLWTPAAWAEVREKVAEAVDVARDEALEQLETSAAARKRVGDTRNKAA